MFYIELIKGPSSLATDYGSSAELNCSARGSGKFTFIWHQVNYGIVEVHFPPESFMEKTADVTDTLLLSNITRNVTYQCTVVSEGHSFTSRRADIAVSDPPSELIA